MNEKQNQLLAIMLRNNIITLLRLNIYFWDIQIFFIRYVRFSVAMGNILVNNLQYFKLILIFSWHIFIIYVVQLQNVYF